MGGSSGKIKWTPVDMSDKTVIVTGGNTGIGYETAKQLAFMGARVIMACRDETRGRDAITRINQEYAEMKQSESSAKLDKNSEKKTQKADSDAKSDACDEQTAGNQKSGSSEQTTGNSEQAELRLEFMCLDLSSLDSVQQFTSEFKSRGYPLHILICNAGIALVLQGKTEDGFERHFQINYLGHFLLILNLLPVMRATDGDRRIISVSSSAHKSGSLVLTNVQGQTSYNRFDFYGNSKLFQIMMTYALERRLKDTQISVFSLHPGPIDTELTRNSTDSMMIRIGVSAVRNLGVLKDMTHGAATTILLAVSPDVTQHSGSYYSEGKRIEPASQARNESDQEVLWKYSLECLGDRVSPELLQDLQS